MVCPLGNNQEMLQGPSVSITHKERNSSTLKITIISRKRKRKNVWQSANDYCENGSTMTQKKVLKWSAHLKAMEKRYRNLV